jgi:hypothetical protein
VAPAKVLFDTLLNNIGLIEKSARKGDTKLRHRLVIQVLRVLGLGEEKPTLWDECAGLH